jgi:hypothetical protein
MARAALGWSTSELARRARVGVATVNRFETIQGETTPTTVEAMQRTLESAGAIFDSDGLGGVRMRKMREGDLVRRKRQYSERHPGWKDTIRKVVEVERHPQTGPTYRVWVDSPDNDRPAGLFAFEFELVKAAPEWSSKPLSNFQVLREDDGLGNVIVRSFDDQKLVLTFVPIKLLEDYFGLAGERRPTIAECSSLVDINLPAIRRVIEGKYARGEYRMLNRYGSTHPLIELTVADIRESDETLSMPSTECTWVRS